MPAFAPVLRPGEAAVEPELANGVCVVLSALLVLVDREALEVEGTSRKNAVKELIKTAVVAGFDSRIWNLPAPVVQ